MTTAAKTPNSSEAYEAREPVSSKSLLIKWEDDDGGFDFGASEEAVTAEQQFDDPQAFAALLDDNEPEAAWVKVGEKISGRVAVISERAGAEEVLIDLGGKLSGILPKSEVLDEHGQLQVKVGDQITAFVLSRQGQEILLGMNKSQSLKSLDDLAHAQREKLAVRGRVVKHNKGGFEVLMLGKTAFCPISQIDSKFVDKPELYLNQEFEFLIERFDPRGRNTVVSRARLLKQRSAERLQELLATLKPETILDGVVSQVRDFGAFVDLGGVEGMVHVSELSLSRVTRVADVVAIGDKVRVKILRIEGDATKPKIALSMKATSQDPWDDITQHVQVGESYTGRVTNLLHFGAFIELKPGIEGLLHVSEMSWTKRIHHPGDVVKLGDVVTVTLKDINSEQRRLSLTMKQVEDNPWYEAASRYPVDKITKATVERLRPFGAILELAPGVSGLLPTATLKKKFGDAYKQQSVPGKELEVKIVSIDLQAHKILLTLTGIESDADDGREDYLAYVRDVMTPNQSAVAPATEANSGGSAGSDRQGSFGALLAQKIAKK